MQHAYQDCIEACLKCIQACRQCAASCLREADVTAMAACIRLDLEAAVVCEASIELMTLGSNFANRVCQLCADVCLACAEECEKHDMGHCRECAAACSYCAEQCMSMAAA